MLAGRSKGINLGCYKQRQSIHHRLTAKNNQKFQSVTWELEGHTGNNCKFHLKSYF